MNNPGQQLADLLILKLEELLSEQQRAAAICHESEKMIRAAARKAVIEGDQITILKLHLPSLENANLAGLCDGSYETITEIAEVVNEWRKQNPHPKFMKP